MRARLLTLLTILVVSLGLAVAPVAAAADSAPTATAAATKKAKAKKKQRKAKLPTARQCTPKAMKRLKGKQRKQRQAACKRRKTAKRRPVAPGAPVNGPVTSRPSAASPAPAARAGTPAAKRGAFDYGKLPLTDARHEVTKDTLMLPMADGRSVYVEVVRPKAPGRYGVILESSPYHGTLYNREGWRILPQPTKPGKKTEPQGLTGYFAPRGYAVVMMDLRGTGKSQGCLDHLGQKDGADLKRVVEWAATQSWSNGRVGMVGHSYVGSTPAVAAAQNPKGLVTIVPSAGLASMYDHQYQAGVPWAMQWAGPVAGYQGLAFARALPPDTAAATGVALGTDTNGDNFGKDPHEAACGMTQNALVSNESMLSGQYVGYHKERDWADGLKGWDGTIWTVHGINDEAARIASLHWLHERGTRSGDKVWIGQWNHGIGCCPNRRGLQWTAALHAWFDRQLLERDVDTGPAVELFMNDGQDDVRAIDRQGETFQAKQWPPAGATALKLHTSSTNALADAVPAEGSNVFSADAGGFTTDRYRAGGVDFRSAPFARDTLIAGVPKVELALSQTVERLHSIVTLIDESPNGAMRRISTCAMNPELRGGIDTIKLVIPGERMALRPPCFAMAHHLRAGHRLVLKVAASDDDHVPTFAIDPRVTVFSGKDGTRVTLPVVEDKTGLVKDDIDLKAKGFAGSGA